MYLKLLLLLDMIDIIGFNSEGVHIIYGNGRTNNFEIRGGSSLKIVNEFNSNDGYTS